MKAARLHDYGAPLKLEDVAPPDLREPDDVIVRVEGCGVCRTDLHLIDGALDGAIPDTRPLTVGHEITGRIEAVGRRHNELAVGQPVIVHPVRSCGNCERCRRGQDMFCAEAAFTGLWDDGGFAEFVRTSTRAVVPLSDELDPASLAPYADAGLTVMRAAKKASALLSPGGSVVIIGVGGLGHIAVQLLRLMTAARIIAVDRSKQALELATKLGADYAVPAAEATERISELTQGRGADLVVDLVGEDGTPQTAVEVLCQGGVYLLVGYGEPLDVPTAQVVVKEIRIEGTLVGTYTELVELMELVGRGQLVLHTRTYALDAVNEALDDLRARKVLGRAIVVPTNEGIE
jgi:NAD+-dependent secondary alcohol dehydrogenase Adh1